MRRGTRPCGYIASGDWPFAKMKAHRGAEVAQAVARALAQAMEGQGLSANALAKRSGVNRQVVTNVLNGTVWPDLLTVVDLEVALGVPLWPDHLQWTSEELPAPRPESQA
ncbi:helix-turn-helix domain-containing protein [Kitasatospora sp. NPDC001547]|uniref:helix-turn-helix domain-containing protein n=1 Tax=Kitasatospora sp. NPDC001547 TaxID=3364015 RepID=UPI0036BB4917|nr:hypothetical protein KitaXyl93_42750 [Kitasatospora sp. Xyl93]